MQVDAGISRVGVVTFVGEARRPFLRHEGGSTLPRNPSESF